MRYLLLSILLLPCAAKAEYPNERAYFLHHAAVLADLPELCAKIPATMQYTAGFNPRGYQIYALRSKCYYDTALRHRHPALCDAVQAVSTPFLSGDQISAAQCRARMGSHLTVADPIAPKQDTVLRLFAEMGYTPDTAAQRLPILPRGMTLRDFLDLRNRPDIRRRVLQALQMPEDLAAADRDVLHDMAGVVTQEIAWCQKIDPARLLREDQATQDPYTRWNMAHWCVFKIAFNTDNPALCETLPKTHAPGLTPLYSLAGQCRAQIAAFHDPQNTARRSRYGFNPIQDEAQRSRLTRLLGYAAPSAADLPRAELARRLLGLLRDIGQGRLAREDPQIQVLLDKLKSLPKE